MLYHSPGSLPMWTDPKAQEAVLPVGYVMPCLLMVSFFQLPDECPTLPENEFTSPERPGSQTEHGWCVPIPQLVNSGLAFGNDFKRELQAL